MTALINWISDVNDLIMQGESLEAFEKFYHEDVVIQKNNEPAVEGKIPNRKMKKKELNDIIEFRCAKPLKVTIGEQTTMVEWHLNYKHRLLGELDYTQVAVQDWKEGLIIKEKLYSLNKLINILNLKP